VGRHSLAAAAGSAISSKALSGIVVSGRPILTSLLWCDVRSVLVNGLYDFVLVQPSRSVGNGRSQ
jgi:hypothetical protein